jgi:hypothetical protein
MPPDASGGGGLLAVIERLATNPQLNIETFQALLAARRQEEDRAAKRAFNAAMSAAKGEIEPILKKREVDFTTQKGRTRYKFEELADISRVIDPVFQRHGLSYRFSVKQEGGKLAVSCILSHADGYSEEMPPLEGTIDAGGTNMNALQALGSALTYLQRYALRAALGLAAGRDDDARSASAGPKISIEQANELQKLIDETGRSQSTLLRLVGVENVVDMTVDQWTRAKEVLDLAKAERRRVKNAAAGDV